MFLKGFCPLTPGFVAVEYGNLAEVEKAINKNTCGILVEPMQGEGGMNVPPEGFLKGLRELSDKNDLILLFDEIQVGLGRTGKRFAFEHENVIPDGLILGNAMDFCRKLLDLGVLANDSHGHTIRISPPLIINDQEIDFLVKKMEKVFVG